MEEESPETISKSNSPGLSYKEKLFAFIFFNFLGYVIQLGSLSNFYTSIVNNDPARFAFLYSIGNIFSLIGTFIYVGINTQLSNMTNKERRVISLVFMISLVFCILYPLLDDSQLGKLLTTMAVIVQMISYWIYTLSFFPKIQYYLSNFCSSVLSCFKKSNQFFNKNTLNRFPLIMSNYHYLMKFILLGESGVGKSCMLFQFLENKFSDNLEPTIGIEFGTKMIEVNKKQIRLQIWDSAGQENYRSITRSYYRNTICSFLIYDISQKQTFDNLKIWFEEAQTYGNSKMYFFLIGNKTDLEDQREVSKYDAIQFAKQNGMQFLEVSAKNDVNIAKCFEEAAKQIMEDIENEKLDPHNETLGVRVGLNSNNDLSFQAYVKKKKKKCC